MNPRCSSNALAAIAWSMCSAAAFGERAAGKPDIVVGDLWQFARTTTGAEAKSGTWSRTATEAPGGERLTGK
ncbi:MAG TPA: hypothetical protein PLW68_09125 [Casimicrobiaceae bacterium]|nr:hypothetical protein [Casimicrobiaceae bacterium]